MDMPDEAALLDQHRWFTTSVQAKGIGEVGVPKRDIVFTGPTSIALDRKNALAVHLEIQDVSQENISMFDIAINVREFEAFRLETPDGIYTASEVGYSGISTGNTNTPASIKLSPSILEFVASTEKPFYWVMPLENFLQDFLQSGEVIGQHPLRLNPESRIVEFLWQGKPAFIELLLDYNKRVK